MSFLLPKFVYFNLTKQANNEKLLKRLCEYYRNLSEEENIKKRDYYYQRKNLLNQLANCIDKLENT